MKKAKTTKAAALGVAALALLASLPTAAQHGNITRGITYTIAATPDEAQQAAVDLATQQYLKVARKPATKLDMCEQLEGQTVLLIAHAGGPGAFVTILYLQDGTFQVSTGGNGNAKFKNGCRPLDQVALGGLLRSYKPR